MTTAASITQLPWVLEPGERKRFNRVLWIVTLLLFPAAVIVPYLPVSPLESPPPAEPPRLARLVLKPTPQPAPEPVQPEPKARPSRPKPEPKAPAQVKSKQPVRPAEQPKPNPNAARRKARSAGLVALRDELETLRRQRLSTGTVSSASSRRIGESEPVTSRSVITSRVAATSRGIDSSRLSRDVGSTQLAGREPTRARHGGGGDSATGTGASAPSAPARHTARSIEEIQMVFDRNKGAIYALYHRALRRDPTLQGKLVLELTIAPDGTVTQCKVVSSELGAESLSRKVVARVSLFDFGAKDVEVTVVTYPIEFLPS